MTDLYRMRDLGIGFGLGFFVALQLGPMSLFLIRSTLRAGLRVGLAIGAGIACVDALYAVLGAAGAAPFLAIGGLRIALGIAGAVVLLVLGVRTLRTAFWLRAGLEAADDVATPRRAFVASVAGTASNPATIGSWAAIFAAASLGTGADPLPLVAGVGTGSLAWVVALALVVAVSRRALGTRAIRIADTVAGFAMIGFAGLFGYRAAHSS